MRTLHVKKYLYNSQVGFNNWILIIIHCVSGGSQSLIWAN